MSARIRAGEGGVAGVGRYWGEVVAEISILKKQERLPFVAGRAMKAKEGKKVNSLQPRRRGQQRPR